MTEQKIQELIQALFSQRITKTFTDRSQFVTDAIDKEGRTIVENIIRNFLLENRDEQFGILQAKVFMYEQIISKSNFAPMIRQPRKVKS